jgi:hypothetical protein
VTSVTLLTTAVYSSEVIQVAKCSPNTMPATNAHFRSLTLTPRTSGQYRRMTSGVNTSVATIRRAAASTSEGADSACASRINRAAVEVARIPVPSAA